MSVISKSPSIFLLVICILLTSCDGSSNSSKDTLEETPKDPNTGTQCSRSDIEETLQTTLNTMATDADFSFYIEDSTGENFAFNRGASTLNTAYRSASTSKWIATAAILQLVDDGTLSLSDKPQDHLSISEWTIDSLDPLYNLTLGQLLSFTSGLYCIRYSTR